MEYGKDMTMETATSDKPQKKPQLRWQLIDSPQGREFLTISFGLFGVCGLGFIICGLIPFIVRALIVAGISFAGYLVCSLRKRPVESEE